MKMILTTLAVGSIIVVGGCKKTKTVATETTATLVSQTEPIEMDVSVKVDNGEIVVVVNGEERSIGDLSELMHNIDFGDGDDSIEVHIEKMMGDEGSLPEGTHVYMMEMMDGEGPPEGMREHMMKMMGDRGEGGGHPKMIMMHGGDGPPAGTREHMMKMMGDRGEGGGHPKMVMMHGGDGPPAGTREHMMKMMGDRGEGGGHPKMAMMHGGDGPPEGMREHMMHDGGEHGEWSGEWREHKEDRDISEEHQFMEELSMLDEVSSYMTPHSMSMFGIRMIRDELEPEDRIKALERIISQTDEGSPSRNAALIVSIETLQELDRQEEAVDLMIELVVSN